MPKNEITARKYHENRKRFIEFLGGKCIKCGSTEKLEFDHIDPSRKSFNVSRWLHSSYDSFYLELDKCQILCNKCHKEKTRIHRIYLKEEALKRKENMKNNPDKCSVDGCDRPPCIQKHGLCRAHLQHYYRCGDPGKKKVRKKIFHPPYKPKEKEETNG